MYLFIFCDGTAKQVTENLSIADILAAKQKSVSIYRFHNNHFQRLAVKDDVVVWISLREAKPLCYETARVHS